MSETFQNNQRDVSVSVATEMAEMCVVAIANSITEILEKRFAEKNTRSIHKFSDRIVHRKEMMIPLDEYNSIVESCLTDQLREIFNGFYRVENAFCIELASRVCSIVREKTPEDVREDIINLFEDYYRELPTQDQTGS